MPKVSQTPAGSLTPRVNDDQAGLLMDRLTHTALISRRSLLKASGGALAAATVVPHLGAGTATAQTPKRGGTLSLRLWDPPHFDPHLTVSYKTHILHTFTHSRLLRHKAGPSV